MCDMARLGRVELPHPAPEAGALSTELQAHMSCKIYCNIKDSDCLIFFGNCWIRKGKATEVAFPFGFVLFCVDVHSTAGYDVNTETEDVFADGRAFCDRCFDRDGAQVFCTSEDLIFGKGVFRYDRKKR